MWTNLIRNSTPLRKPRLGDLRYWLGIALTILSVALLLRGVDFDRMAEVFKSINYVQATITLLAVILTILLKAIRWKMLFQPPSDQPSTGGAISILTIGQMINMVFPLRFGEVGRVYMAAEIEGSPPALTTTSIVIEKTIDSLMLLICAALVLPFAPLPDWLRQSLLTAIPVALTAAIVVFGLAQWGRGTRVALSAMFGILPQRVAGILVHQADAALQGMAALRQPSVFTPVALLSVAIWILAALTNYTAFQALGITVPFVAAVFLLVVLQIGVAIPSAPGRVGVFQALTVLGLSLFGVDPSTALTYSILLHAAVFIPPSVAGIFLLWHENSNIHQRRKQLSSHQVPMRGGPL